MRSVLFSRGTASYAFEPVLQRRVLVIDDYAGGRAAVAACLTELGCESVGVGSSIVDHTISWLEHVDLVIANHDPPWVDAGQVIAKLRRTAPRLPAIVLVDHPRRVPNELMLRKPVDLDELHRALQLVNRLLH